MIPYLHYLKSGIHFINISICNEVKAYILVKKEIEYRVVTKYKIEISHLFAMDKAINFISGHKRMIFLYISQLNFHKQLFHFSSKKAMVLW